MRFRKTRISILTLVMFVVAGAMFAFGALNFGLSPYITSDNLESQFKLDHVGVNLFENGKPIENNDGALLAKLDGKVAPGKKYTEEIAVHNSSEVNQYVRVIVRKYIKNADGTAATDMSPDEFIHFTYKDDEKGYNSGSWIINDKETTTETTTYYYKSALKSGKTTENLMDQLQLDASLAEKEEHKDGSVITYTYKYDGIVVCIEAEAQALQPHNINDAIKSVWGVQNVSVSGDTLSVE